jgi:beta-glucanase (GH16 family)
MNSKTIIRGLFFLLLTAISFQNCSQDSEDGPKPVVNPPVVNPVIDPNPSTSNIPSTAPTICDFELTDAYVQKLDSLGWTKVFEDNFDGDLAKWNVWTGGAFNNELQHYQQSNLQLLDGKLIITAKKETVTGSTNPYNSTQKTFDYTSGRIETKTLFSPSATASHVRMMARIKLPSGIGMWPAFWSYGADWPTQGEIDVIEARGQETGKYHTNYFYGTTAGSNVVSNASATITADGDLSTCYHVYELIWEKNKLLSLLDGKVVEAKTSGGYIASLFGKQEMIVLNLAVGGDFFSDLDPNTIEPNAMSVDWVKVYTAK